MRGRKQRMRQGQTPSRPRETRPVPRGRERRREVKADLDSFEPPAERLRRCDGDTGPQRAHFFPQGGKCASAQALPSRSS